MPKVRNPFFSFRARGSVSKQLTARQRDHDTVIEKRPYPKDAKTSPQLAWRTMYQACTDLWHTLSASEKQQWERDARPYHMTGYAYYMSLCLKPNPGIYLPLAGGTMSGVINMGTNKITDLAAPTNPNDAARLADAGGGGSKIQDTDGDTSWDTEESADKDEIQGKVKTVEFFRGHDDGIITLAKQSMISVYKSTSTVVPDNTWVRLNFNVEFYDVQSEYDNATNFRFTATKAGKYLISAAATWQTIIADKAFLIAIQKNGTYIHYSWQQSSINNWISTIILSTVALAATDYIEIHVKHFAGANQTVYSGSEYNWFQITKVA